MRIVVIVQARMGSRRLPGKVMFDLQGKTVLGHVLSRLQCCRAWDDLLVATSTLTRDDVIAEEAARYQVDTFRGSEPDVLQRYVQAARYSKADAVVRITADCPLLDAEIVSAMIRHFRARADQLDLLSNVQRRTFPKGLDVEIVSAEALAVAYREAATDEEKEHVTTHFYRHPERFRLDSYTHLIDYSSHRWTLDTWADWSFIREVYRRLYPGQPCFRWLDVLRLLEREPDLRKMEPSS